MTPRADGDPVLVDAAAGEIGNADVILVFGTAHWSPAEVAAELFLAGRAPWVIVTGGSARKASGVGEAVLHRSLMVARGVPEDRILVETKSSNTYENVRFALPLLERIGPVKTVLAVVKWYHRRALVLLAEQAPTVERLFAADYEPLNPVTRRGLSRADWEHTCPRSVERETEYLRDMQQSGRDLLRRTDLGWSRGGTV